MPSIKGLQDIFGSLDASLVEMHAAAAEVVVQVGGEMASNAARLAPVLEDSNRVDREAGALRDSIGVLSFEDTGSKVSCTVGTKLFYAPFVEFGTINTTPHAFMRPAKAKARRQIKSRTRAMFRARVKALKAAS